MLRMLLGKIYSIICTQCNLLVVKKAVVVISHNLAKRDALTILKSLKSEWVSIMKIIARNDDIVSMTWAGDIKFVDSSELMQSSLSEINHSLQSIARKISHWRVYKQVYSGFSHDPDPSIYSFHLTFPSVFTWSGSSTRADFPMIAEFPEEDINDNFESYGNSKCAFVMSNSTNMLDYAHVYSQSLLFQLADGLQRFNTWGLENFKISPLYSPTLSSFGFDAMFAITGARFEHVKDPSIITWISNGLKAGLSFANVRKANANNERIGNFNGKKEQRSHIIELDLNGAYAAGASMNLCEGEHEWMTDEQLSTLDLMKLEDEGSFGYILEVDMMCPDSLHSFHDPLPPAVVRRTIDSNELSDDQQIIYNSIAALIRSPFSEERLILDLNQKKNYVVYHKLLKLYVSKGMVVTKIHKGLRFRASPYMKPGVDLVSGLRKDALIKEDNIINRACKGILCGMYGKFMTNTADHRDVRPCTSKTECVYLTAKASFVDITVVTDDFSLVHLSRNTVYHPHSLINAFIILENCRFLVYSGWYFLRNHFNENISLLAGETDSLRLQIFDKDNTFLEKMAQLSDFIDYSALPESHPLYSSANQCKVGMWKLVQLNIFEFISIKSKLFSYVTRCDLCKQDYTEGCLYCKVYTRGRMGAAGVNKSFKSSMSHDFYRQLLSSTEVVSVNAENNQRKFTSLDIRRYFPANCERSFAFGNHELSKQRSDI
jgi:hypothetical protein